MKNELFEKDLYRYYEGKESIKNKILRPLELRDIYNMRCASCAKNTITKLYYKIKLRRLQEKTMIQISEKTKIGEGFYILHTGRIIINPKAVIGKNVNIATGVTIGQENRGKRKGSPTIGNQVCIETNAVIVGKINIGNNVLIAPNSYVNFDVPDNSIVIGNPATIHENINATKDYVNNMVK